MVKPELIPEIIDFIRLVWCDNANIIRAKALHRNCMMKGIKCGISRAQQAVPVMYDSVVEGSGLDPVGEITLQGDMNTFTPLPYAPGHGRVMVDMMEDNKPWEHCPRNFLKNNIKKVAKKGLTLNGAFENEFYLLKKDSYIPADNTGFASTYSMDYHLEVLQGMVQSLISQNIPVEQYYPESGPGQQEITMKYSHPLQAADNQITFRETIHALARKHGLKASFLPKIYADKPGSGCHLHLSLWDDDKNILSQEDGEYGLSTLGESFIAGILDHLPSLMAITTPSTNSYRRLQPNMWSGAFQCWGFNNREAAIRVVKTGEEPVQHFELKTLDCTANPYLALGGVMAAGMDGINRKMELKDPLQTDPTKMSVKERREREVVPLPSTLKEALQNLEEDEVLKKALGKGLSQSYIAVKRAEWEAIKDYSLKDEVKMFIDKF